MAHVLIAGAGIGGLTAALTLARIGVEVTLLERARAFEELGTGIQLSPNASRILGRLGVLEALAEKALRATGIKVRSAGSGRILSVLSLDDAEPRWGAPYLVLHRADLQQALVAAVANEPAIDLHLDTSVAGFGTTERGVTVTAKQGLMSRSFEADALVGADGVGSSVRARLAGGMDDQPTEAGRTAWRALIDTTTLDPMFATSDTGLWLGRDAHLVHYPLRGGRLLNVVAITRDRKAVDPRNLWSRPGDNSLIQQRYAGWHRTARDLIASASSWMTWPLYDRAPLAAWNAGPVALLGDAAHPILPFLAQGAAQAIEDAAALAGAVAATRSLTDALAAYSNARIARATRVQETSRDLGRIYHLSGPAALARDAAMRLAGPHRLLSRYDWLYGHGFRST